MEPSDKQSNFYKSVGKRIRERRKLLRLTQTELAALMGLSYQQVQKYETGANNISLERLIQFAKLLNVGPEHFYQGLALEDAVGVSDDSDVIVKIRRKLQITLVEDSVADAMLFKKAAEPLTDIAEVHCIDDPDKLADYINTYKSRHSTHTPDIIILDLHMPKKSGLQLLKELKNNSQTSMMPVIVLTNSISRKEMHEAYRLGAAGFVQKSAEFQEYKELLEILIQYWSRVVALPSK